METMINIISILLFLAGIFFFVVGTVGLLRLPDAITRVHATTKADTLGLGLIVVGLVLMIGFNVTSLKLIFVLVFVWITNPTAAHVISKAKVNQKDRKEEKQ